MPSLTSAVADAAMAGREVEMLRRKRLGRRLCKAAGPRSIIIALFGRAAAAAAFITDDVTAGGSSHVRGCRSRGSVVHKEELNML